MSEKYPMSWEKVARLLGARMEHHAFCVDHRAADPDPACPFCQDRSAYGAFTDKLGYVPADPFAGARTVPIEDLRRHFNEQEADHDR